MSPTDTKQAPVISPLRTIKNIPDFVKNPIPVLDEYISTAGDTFSLYLGPGNKATVTADPGLIQHILQKNHRNYRKSHLQTDQLAHFIGNGLLTSDGDYWLQQRRLIQPGFHRKKLSGLAGIVLGEIDLYLDRLQRRITENNTVDMFAEMTELTFNVVAKSLFSSDVEKRVLDQLSDHFNRIQSFVAKKIRQPFLSSWFHLSGEHQKHEAVAVALKDIVRNIVRQRKQSGVHPDDLLDMLLDVRYEDTGEGMTERQVLEESLILFIAGHETSANALAWTWYLLCRHPEAAARIRQEVETVLGDAPPTFESLPGLVYLDQVLQESMRLYPPAWILDRVPVEDDAFEGIALPRNQNIGIYTYGVHRNPKYWPDPEKFDPSRFTKEEIKKRPAFTYLPFGGGPRLCIGANFAMMEMQMALARMIQRFDFELIPDRPVELAPLITLRPKNGIWIRVNKRQDVLVQ
ncbi:MAG: cytochrome P450 [Bacteroidetes bacterium]|nr:MAG: cytochrome P450 [Bacteroidota bacterium]